MTRRTAARRVPDRETSGAIDFDAALNTWMYVEVGCDEELLEAAGIVLHCALPFDPERADELSTITGYPYQIESYGDAARAVRYWFGQIGEWETRH